MTSIFYYHSSWSSRYSNYVVVLVSPYHVHVVQTKYTETRLTKQSFIMFPKYVQDTIRRGNCSVHVRIKKRLWLSQEYIALLVQMKTRTDICFLNGYTQFAFELFNGFRNDTTLRQYTYINMPVDTTAGRHGIHFRFIQSALSPEMHLFVTPLLLQPAKYKCPCRYIASVLKCDTTGR